ncbi:MAG: hypothetical protein OQK55_02050 [Thermoanaerobaculales bacterium]|nr:hypothetical protein [Thermoanaerobaculales bacterium]
MSSHERKTLHESTKVALIAMIVAIAVLTPAAPVKALETGVCRIEVLVDGKPLAEYAARGTTYIEALHGREYALRLTNLIDRRIAVALAVDGLNSIDAKTTSASKASKWVLGPYQTTTISGWQVSSTDARRFFFTTEEESYGTWLGRDTNLGVIEAVVYREKKPRLILGQWLGSSSKAAPAPSGRARPSAETGKRAGEAADADDLAATGIGRRVDHRVQRVHLDLEDRPASKLRLRYEYRQQLVHLGVLPSPEEETALARREKAHGFSDFSFAPDPFAHGR